MNTVRFTRLSETQREKNKELIKEINDRIDYTLDASRAAKSRWHHRQVLRIKLQNKESMKKLIENFKDFLTEQKARKDMYDKGGIMSHITMPRPTRKHWCLTRNIKEGHILGVSMKLRIPHESFFTWTQTIKKDFLLIEGSIKLTFR